MNKEKIVKVTIQKKTIKVKRNQLIITINKILIKERIITIIYQEEEEEKGKKEEEEKQKRKNKKAKKEKKERNKEREKQRNRERDIK